MTNQIKLITPPDHAQISFLTQEQKNFLTDPYRFSPHEPVLEPRKGVEGMFQNY